MSTRAKLLDQHHRIPHRIVRKHSRDVSAFEDFTHELGAPSAVMKAVAQSIPVDTKITLKNNPLLDYIDIVGHGDSQLLGAIDPLSGTIRRLMNCCGVSR